MSFRVQDVLQVPFPDPNLPTRKSRRQHQQGRVQSDEGTAPRQPRCRLQEVQPGQIPAKGTDRFPGTTNLDNMQGTALDKLLEISAMGRVASRGQDHIGVGQSRHLGTFDFQG